MRSWTGNGTGVLMDTTLSMNQEHAFIDLKGPGTLDYITMRVATRLRTVMIFPLFSPHYPTSRKLHQVFGSSVQKRHLQAGGSSGEGIEMVRTEEAERLGELG